MEVTAVFSDTGCSKCVEVSDRETAASLLHKACEGASHCRRTELVVSGSAVPGSTPISDLGLESQDTVQIRSRPYPSVACPTAFPADEPNAFAVSPCGRWLAVANGGFFGRPSLQLHSLEDGTTTTCLDGHAEGNHFCLAFTPCSGWLAVGCGRDVAIISIPDCREHRRLGTTHPSGVLHLDISLCGQWALSYGRSLRIWDWESGECTAVGNLDVSTATCCGALFTPCSSFVLVADNQGVAWVDLEGVCVRRVDSAVVCFCIHPFENSVVAMTQECFITWDVASGQLTSRIEHGSEEHLDCSCVKMCMSPSDSSIYTIDSDTLRHWSASTASQLHQSPVSVWAPCVAVSPCGRYMVCHQGRNEIMLKQCEGESDGCEGR
eukprot:TRINITY_DN14932_c0_g1_i2.p1 TRINITY_DN14932_c0_g1~~TRINITY_DN14932_c0_g1_i2.p1  ORF type:complete len:419 (+),score=111.16 TRINITY_DN14932_c0_g1_i2:121-1257(+)